MASAAPPPETAPPPSGSWLLCAACGPLGEEHAREVGCNLRETEGVQAVGRGGEVLCPVPFLTLRHWVKADESVQQAVAQVLALRGRRGVKTRSLTRAEIAGSARGALLLGKARAFMLYYRDYVRQCDKDRFYDPGHMFFWDSVLGPGWEGIAAVPEGAARDEALPLLATAFAFFKLPPGCGPAGFSSRAVPNEEWLEAAAALRAADHGGLNAPPAADSLPAGAARDMLTGTIERARKKFERLLGRSEDLRYRILGHHGFPLLIYALLAGVLGGGNRQFLQVWFGAARYAVEYVFPPSMVKEQREMMSFLDSLELVDALVNRLAVQSGDVYCFGSLSSLPFAMAYGSLPAYLRRKLEPAALAAGVEELSGRGLHLLARYGATGLCMSGELCSEWQARMDILSAGDMKRSVWGEPVTVRACRELEASVLQQESPIQEPHVQTLVLTASRTADGAVIELPEDICPGEKEPLPHSLRCMLKYADGGRLVLEGASPVELTRLFASLLSQVEIVGSLVASGEAIRAAAPEPVLLLAHLGGGACQAALRLRLLPGAAPLLPAGCGLAEPVLEGEGGTPLAVRRNMADEWRVLEQSTERLKDAGLSGAETLLRGSLTLPGFDALAKGLRICREAGVECCWAKGYELCLHQPPGGLDLRCGQRQGEWLELGGGLPVDEGRVLELSALLEAYAQREEGPLRLGTHEYVLLNPTLEHQLTLVELIRQENKGRQGISASAIPLLESLERERAETGAQRPPVSTPGSLQATLRPYQAEGYRWLVQRAEQGMGALLADDMGLGKTVQVLACLLHAAEQPGSGPALVVAPVSLLGNWAEEAARFAPTLKVTLYTSSGREALAGAEGGSLVLASYGQIVSRPEDFRAVEWGGLVLDEAQAIKNPDSRRAKAVCALRAHARFCLTGTPIENSLLDLWSQMRFLNPGLFGTRADFLRRFRKRKQHDLTLLRQVLAPLVLRRSKADVLRQLPPLTETVEWVDFSREERALYESLRRSALRKLGPGEEAGGIGILAELTRLRRACCHGKLVLEDFAGNSSKLAAMTMRVAELRVAGRRALIFSQFTDVLDLAQQALQTAGISYLRLDGSTPAAQRSKVVRAFQNGGADSFLISLKAGGAGLNLTAADYVILLDPWWNPAVEAQAAGRSHRLGQQQAVTLCRFMVRGTVEERILALHRDKKELAESILRGMGESLSQANLRALLS